MNINFNLATPKSKVSSIKVIVTHRGIVYRKAVGVSVPVKDWSQAKQKSGHSDIDSRIKSVRMYLDANLDETSNDATIRRAIEMAVLPEEERNKYAVNSSVRPTFDEFMRARYQRIGRPADISLSNSILLMMGRCDWENIDSRWLDVLQRRMTSHGWSKNTQGLAIKLVRATMNEGRKLKYHKMTDHMDVRPPREESFAIYLTKSEVDALWEYEFTDPYMAKARDLFIVGIYTASRHSDYSRLSMDNVRDGYLEFVQKKTRSRVVLPLSPRVRAVMERNGGKVPYICPTTFGLRIKEACRAIGMTQVVQVSNTVRKRLHKSQNEPVFKYELVSSHTARRTGATLLYMSGIPIGQCRMITGHKSEAMFLNYIKTTREENARMLADNPFFKE